MSGSGYRYEIPILEQQIHSRVIGGEFDQSRLTQWQSEIARMDVVLIETVLSNEIRSRSYGLMMDVSLFTRLISVVNGFVRLIMGVLRHYLFHALAQLGYPRAQDTRNE